MARSCSVSPSHRALRLQPGLMRALPSALVGLPSVTSEACKPESRRNPKPTEPAVQISDANRKRKILIADKYTMALRLKKNQDGGPPDKGESLRVRSVQVH